MFHTCIRGIALFALLFGCVPTTSHAQTVPDILVQPGVASDLPRIVPNDNRASAGRLTDGVLDINLEIVRADWRVETPEGPGLRVAAIAEKGKAPSVPGPMIRVETGTAIRATITNTLSEYPVTVFGLHRRPAEAADSLILAPGTSDSLTFDAGEPGTYYYWMRVEDGHGPDEEREQLAGAFIIDPAGGSSADRVFVMNIFSTAVDTAFHDYGWLEALTINGLSWPFTERQRPAVGDTLRWRVINATDRGHPMHLHGFYYDVTSRGTALSDDLYDVNERRHVVTENMSGGSTMTMEWIPRRPGNWLFHCHLSFHVSPDIRLPVNAAHETGEMPVHMAGLVLGIEVQQGSSDLISKGDERHITLHAKEFGPDSVRAFAFTLDPDYEPDVPREAVPGPVLVMRQYQPTLVTVQNDMSISTGVHWHGLELDSWSDGVPGWSASDGRVSPAIPPGGSFTYKLSLMRPGTFIYHSHLDDVHQLTGGLYGALIVLADGEEYDPATDHNYLVGWRNSDPQAMEDVELNGRMEQPERHTVVGETHRIRLINIAPAGAVFVTMQQDGLPVPLHAMAKDGADLPVHQQVEILRSPRYGVGETADFRFAPTAPGTYELFIGYMPQFGWTQTWIVEADPEDTL